VKPHPRTLEWIWSLSDLSFTAVLLAGMVAAVAGSRVGAYLMLGALGGTISVHLVVGVIGYRRAMARPWPRVSPLDDEDDVW
jgi:hypothetical protein